MFCRKDCYGRSSTDLGSSANWPDTKDAGGLLSSNCTTNPVFCNWNMVYLAYCDGNSFSGNRDNTVIVNGKPLHFRGRRILDAVIHDINQKFAFGSATEVLLTGCSAGGLSTFLHADYVGSLLPRSIRRYGAAPISGFFMNHVNTASPAVPVYANQMQVIFSLANSTDGLNDGCISAHSPNDQWRCNFAPYVLPFIQTPIFVLNSLFDSWQMPCILTAEPVTSNPQANGNCSAVPG
jgi:hypothetical protein